MSESGKLKEMLSSMVGAAYPPLIVVLILYLDAVLFSGNNVGWVVFAIPLYIIGIHVKNKHFKEAFYLSSVIALAAVFVLLLVTEEIFVALSLCIGLLALAVLISQTEYLIDLIRRVIDRDRYLVMGDVKIILLYYVFSIFCFTFLFIGFQLLYDSSFFKIDNPTNLFVDILYFNVVTFTTLGYGDITPLTTMAKLLVAIENIMSFFLVALGMGFIINGIRRDSEDTGENAL